MYYGISPASYLSDRLLLLCYRSWRKEKHSSWVSFSVTVTLFTFHANAHTAGNRWHIDCFRCNTCNTLLDSDAHLLLLGDGSLICSNCTYSCSSCGNKIEDLAILTGDQAFCANCFKCRNCKRRIENLRYARTSQGIFCMDCHESLMQRRRKKKTAAKKPNTIYDKSLPSLPPTMEDTRSNRDVETLPAREYPGSPEVSIRGYGTEERTSSRSRAEEPPAPQLEPPQNQGDCLDDIQEAENTDSFHQIISFSPRVHTAPIRANVSPPCLQNQKWILENF